MERLYRATDKNPYHLSTVGILFNAKNEVVFHHYKSKRWKQIDAEWRHYSTLLSETLRDGEAPEEAVIRGAKEEFNVSAQVVCFLGAGITVVPSNSGSFQKTSLYFVLKVLGDGLPHSTEEGAVAYSLNLYELRRLLERQHSRGVGAGADGLDGLLRLGEDKLHRLPNTIAEECEVDCDCALCSDDIERAFPA